MCLIFISSKNHTEWSENLISGVFANFDFPFWPLLKMKKVDPGADFKKRFIFHHQYESINYVHQDSFNLNKKVVHCYTLIKDIIYFITKIRF